MMSPLIYTPTLPWPSGSTILRERRQEQAGISSRHPTRSNCALPPMPPAQLWRMSQCNLDIPNLHSRSDSVGFELVSACTVVCLVTMSLAHPKGGSSSKRMGVLMSHKTLVEKSPSHARLLDHATLCTGNVVFPLQAFMIQVLRTIWLMKP